MKKQLKEKKEKPVFIVNISVPYNGRVGTRQKEDYIALYANMMTENGYRSIVAAIDLLGMSVLKMPKKIHTLPQVEIHNFKSLSEYFRFIRKFKKATIFGNGRTIVGLSSCFFGSYRIAVNHNSALPTKLWQKIILKFFLKKFDVIKADTEAEKKNLVKFGINPSKIVVVPLPIDYEFFSKKPGKSELSKIRKKYKLNEKDKILLFLAVVRQHKRPDTILKALKILKEKGLHVKLLQVGQDVLKEFGGKSFYELAKEMGVEDCVISTGRIDDEEIRAIMHLADIGIQCSELEGQCLVAFEYAAAALPECLSDIPSFDVFGKNILRNNPDDCKKLAENIEYYLKNPKIAKEHAKNNQKMVREKYNYEYIKKQLKVIFIDRKEEFKKSKRIT